MENLSWPLDGDKNMVLLAPVPYTHMSYETRGLEAQVRRPLPPRQDHHPADTQVQTLHVPNTNSLLDGN